MSNSTMFYEPRSLHQVDHLVQEHVVLLLVLTHSITGRKWSQGKEKKTENTGGGGRGNEFLTLFHK